MALEASVYSNPITLDDIERAFRAGDPQVRQAVLDTGRFLGIAVSNLVGILNIQKIVLSGDMTRFGEAWLDEIRQSLLQHALARLVENTRVETGQLGGNEIILGASAVLANNYSLLFNRQLAMDL